MDTIKTMTQLYKKSSYLDMYGGSVFMTLLVLLIYLIIMSYFSVMKNIKPIKKNWATQRCNPGVIPFAGLINKPPNQSFFSYTGDNFNHCLNNILASIAQDFMQPIDYAVNTFEGVIKGFIKDIQNIRKRFSGMISNIESIDKEIMGRILNFLMPIHKMIIKLKDMIGKVNGVLVANLYTIITGYFGIKAFIGSFAKVMIEGLIALVAIIIPLLLFFFTAPLAIPFLVAFGIVAGFTIAVIVGLEDILHMSTSSVPSKPHCFDPFTIVEMNNGKYKPIKNIRPGDKLKGNNKVTASFKVMRNEDMYCYKSVIVSGSHNVWVDGQWIQVKNIPGIYKVNKYEENVLYCLNTEKQIIEINDTIFADWDDIDDFESQTINKKQSSYSKYKLKEKMLVSYPGDTVIQSIDKSKSNCYYYIKDIRIGTKLSANNYVTGLVKILKENKQLDGVLLSSGANYKNNETTKTIEYHILTTTGKFALGNDEIVEDYNYNLENLL
jgi:hypothetical protein